MRPYQLLRIVVLTFFSFSFFLPAQASLMGQRYELFDLIRAGLGLKEILSSDSEYADVIKNNALLSLALINLTICKTLSQRTCGRVLFTEMMITGPKLLGSVAAIPYDLLRIQDAPHLALKNGDPKKKKILNHFKKQQLIKLAFECALRLTAYIHSDEEQQQHYTVVQEISDIADYMELWRLLSRYSSYFDITGYTLTASVALKKEDFQIAPSETPAPEDSKEHAEAIDNS